MLFKILQIMIILILAESKSFLVTTVDKNNNNNLLATGQLNIDNDISKKPVVEEAKETDYADEEEDELYSEYEEYNEEEKPKIPKSKGKFRSGLMRGQRLTESQIIEKLKKEEIPEFQIWNKEELEKCSPLYYCSNKFMDQVCKPDTQFPMPCRVELFANGGDRDQLGAGKVSGTCKIRYFGCDTSTFVTAATKPAETTTTPITENKEASDDDLDDLFGNPEPDVAESKPGVIQSKSDQKPEGKVRESFKFTNHKDRAKGKSKR